jgi:anti-sigma regulatory factor (Ser/Thr protein kinase)
MDDRADRVCARPDRVRNLDMSPDQFVAGRFAPAMTTPRGARQMVASALEGWGLDDVYGSAALVVSELATNAVKHAGTDLDVIVSKLNGEHVRVEVVDGSYEPPVRPDAPSEESGRGISLVEHFSDDWGAEARPDGKVVWAVIPVGTPA